MKKIYFFLLIGSFIAIPALAQEKDNKTIKTKSGLPVKLNNLIDEPQGSAKLRRAQYNNKQYLLVQFDRIPTASERQAMAKEGIKLYDYLPGNAFMTEMPATTTPATLKKYKVDGAYDLTPEQKISPNLSTPISGSDKYVTVSFYGNVSRESVIQELKTAGAKIADVKIQPKQSIFVHASPDIIKKIAALPFVSFISAQTLKDEMLNNLNRGVHGVQALSLPAGRNLQGQGITMGIGDNGDPSTSTDFTGRLINRNPLPPANHGTHVTGTAAGAGIVFERYKGMAPKSTIISQSSSDILVHTPTYINDYGMVLTNNSYFSGEANCPGNGEYNVLSNYVDDQLRTYPQLLHVFAGGNDGDQTCAPYTQAFATIKSGFQCGKNVLTVGGLENHFYISDIGTSRGPVDDGRLKPEVCAGSAGVNSTRINNAYGPSWGSSMAAPTVTGVLALLYERYKILNGGVNPSGALMKAVVANGADDMGTFGPDFTYGFGGLNARSSVEIIENNTYTTNTVNHGNSVSFNINGVPAGAQQIKIMLYYHDEPAAPNAPTTLVNNLDLSVTAPGGAVHRPLILNPNAFNINDPAIEGIDNRNNIEQVVILNPPAGNFSVTIDGTNIPTGSQQFVVVWQVIDPTIVVEFPYGGERLVPGETEYIHWNAYDASTNTFTIEYTTDNGSSWTTISNNVAFDARTFSWVVPNTPSGEARVRVTRNTLLSTDVSDQAFTILAAPAAFLTSNVCRGYSNLTWTAVPSATSYEIMLLRGDDMMVVGTTTGTSFLLPGLFKDSTYWISVRGVIGTAPGRMAGARSVTPNGGPCSLPALDNDFAMDSLVGPRTGRINTSTQMGTGPIQVQIRNLDNVISSGSYNISYQINGGPVITESSSALITSLNAMTYSFVATFNFSIPNTYIIKAWVDRPGDTQKGNDTLVRVIKHLANAPITLSPTFTEGFESAAAATYTARTLGFIGLDRADFNANTTNGRGRTFINTGFARTGDRAVTLDQRVFTGAANTDSLTTTFNLSSYSAANQLWLDFFYKNQGIDFAAPNNRVWIRGSDLGAWIPVFVLPADDPTYFGVWRPSTPINITESLANAVPAQTVSSSFQVKFGQQGFASTNSVIINGNLDDGFSFDDITFTNALNDVGIQALVSPNLVGICGLGTSEVVEVRVKNYSNVILTNVAVSYRVNAVTVNEVIATLNPGQVYVHTFAQTANLAAFQQYTLDAWVNYPPDNYRNNDSLLNIVFHTTPTITSYPYLEGFESHNGYWYTGGVVSSWEWGAPSKTIINKAANGNNAWVTNLTGPYNNSEISYLYSPCFNLSSLTQPVLSFSHIFRLEDDCDCDFHWVEYSLDDITWVKLGSTTGGTNWYDHVAEQAWQQSNPIWHVASYDVPTTASRVRFRFVMFGDPGVNHEGVGIDDVHVFEKAAIYTGAAITSGLVQNVSGSNWTHFTSGGRRIASINPNGQNLGSTELKVYFNTTGGDRYSNAQYYLDRNLVIQPTNAPGSNVSIRYYFTDIEANNLITATGCGYCTTIDDAYEAGVTKYSSVPAEENGILGDNITGLYSFITPQFVGITPYDNGYYAEYQVNSFSEFWINSGGVGQINALPMELGEFTVTKQNNTGLLKWETTQEQNTDRFIIEKSIDGNNYQSIGTVKAAGNSTSTQRYRFTDVQLLNGVNYYRLRVVDINGAISYSPVRVLNIAGNEAIITLYPNPVRKGVLYVNTSVNCRRVDISDVSGRVLRSFNAQGTRQTIPLHQMAKGTYLVTVVTDNGNKVEKVLVE